MGKKRRGRDRLLTCESCGRAVPRTKAVEYYKRQVYSTDLKGEENVTTFTGRNVYYCISCAKHRKIFEKNKERARREKERGQRP
ncbi:hypothetical protein KAW38_00910 [Candidatus Micrarchaeota archaeon]|nr:hypothetical protein [Candidatus Micrarchaeota archaeon]